MVRLSCVKCEKQYRASQVSLQKIKGTLRCPKCKGELKISSDGDGISHEPNNPHATDSNARRFPIRVAVFGHTFECTNAGMLVIAICTAILSAVIVTIVLTVVNFYPPADKLLRLVMARVGGADIAYIDKDQNVLEYTKAIQLWVPDTVLTDDPSFEKTLHEELMRRFGAWTRWRVDGKAHDSHSGTGSEPISTKGYFYQIAVPKGDVSTENKDVIATLKSIFGPRMFFAMVIPSVQSEKEDDSG